MIKLCHSLLVSMLLFSPVYSAEEQKIQPLTNATAEDLANTEKLLKQFALTKSEAEIAAIEGIVKSPIKESNKYLLSNKGTIAWALFKNGKMDSILILCRDQKAYPEAKIVNLLSQKYSVTLEKRTKKRLGREITSYRKYGATQKVYFSILPSGGYMIRLSYRTKKMVKP